MAIETFVSIKEVISKVYRDLNLQDESRWEDMIEWSAEALQQIGAYMQYVHKSDTLTVENHRVALPCDFHKIVAIEHKGEHLKYLSGDFDTHYHQSNSINLRSNSGYGYNINSAFINTNFKEGTINFAYIAMPVDSEGFPLIPDNVSYKEAAFWYILMKLLLGDLNTSHLLMRLLKLGGITTVLRQEVKLICLTQTVWNLLRINGIG